MFKKSQFQEWGSLGGRMRHRRLLKARMRRMKPMKRRRVSKAAKPPKVKLEKPIKPVDARAQQMADLYRSGNTLEQIGMRFNLTRERVRQLIKRHFPYLAGSVKRDKKNEKRIQREQFLQEKKERRALGVFGVSSEVLREIQGNMRIKETGSPTYAYLMKKGDASARSIPWEFNLASWWKVWQDSGKWALRGRGAHGYCMARIGDIGPYSPSNVQIITNKQNGHYGKTKGFYVLPPR